MQNDAENESAAKLEQTLRHLPLLAAPPSLIPRVLATLQARTALPWWRRPWATWPPVTRLALGTLALAGVGVLGYAGFILEPTWTRTAAATPLSHWLAGLNDSIRLAVSLTEAAATVWRAAAQSLVAGLLLVSTVMYLACLGLGTAFVRVALRRI